MYLVQEVVPWLTHDPSLGETKLSKHSQVPPPAVKACRPMVPSEIVQKAVRSPSEDLTAYSPIFSDAEPCIAPASVPDTTAASSNPSSISDMSRILPDTRRPICDPTSAFDSTSTTLCIPDSASIPPSIPVSICVSDPSSILFSIPDSHSIPSSVFSDVPNSVNNPLSIHNLLSISSSISSTISDSTSVPPSVPFSISVSVPEFPSIHFSVPKHPQLVLRTPHAPYVIRSQLLWPRIHFSHLVSARVCQRAWHPLAASSPAPFPCFFNFVSQRNELCGVGPSGNWPPTHRQATALQLLFYPPKPPDAHRHRCRMP